MAGNAVIEALAGISKSTCRTQLGILCWEQPFGAKGRDFGDDAVGHSGYTGTALLLVPSSETVIALCTNAVYADKDAFLLHRRRIMNVIAGQLNYAN